MSYKWNPTRAKNYSAELAAKLSNAFFSESEKMTGPEILKLTSIKQLNLLVVKNLYEKWQEETAKIKSPFFDFNHSEVEKAFKEFKNVLSRHISVDKAHFTPVLKESIFELLEMHLDTKSYFEKVFKNLPDFKLTEEWLRQNGKYHQTFSWVLAEILNRKQGMTVVYANQAIDWSHEILLENPNRDHRDLDLLNELHPIKLEEPQSFFDEVLENHEPEPIKEAKVETSPEPMVLEHMETHKVKEEESPKSLNDRHVGSVKTLNENLSNNPSLGDSHSQSRINSIRNAISVNQRFLFINNLFGGDVQSFTLALDELEASESFDIAREKMLKKYKPQYNWEISSPEAEEFFDLLKRRF